MELGHKGSYHCTKPRSFTPFISPFRKPLVPVPNFREEGIPNKIQIVRMYNQYIEIMVGR